MRLIDADVFEVVAYKGIPEGYNDTFGDGVDWILEKIDRQPTIVPERKKGKWIERESGEEDKENGFHTVIVCNKCDFPATTFYSEDCESRTQIRTDFCPNCGADMRGAE